jgi:hypothetical protein
MSSTHLGGRANVHRSFTSRNRSVTGVWILRMGLERSTASASLRVARRVYISIVFGS